MASNVTDQIKEKIDIVEFISPYVPLRKAGRSFVGFCPFHPNTRTPAFTVFPDTQSFHCFGCKASGTIFDFLMRREGLSFHDALEQLAQRAGIQIKERTQEDEQQDQLRTRMLEINAAAATFFHHVLIRSPRAEAARAYVTRRGIEVETVEAFQLGYAIEDWSVLLAYLTDRKGFEPQEIEAAGLAIKREHGGYYDRFRNRLMFPIRNSKGQVIAFGGRALGDAQPKYMNSPQTALFEKSRVLYGLDLARDPIRNADAAVIVEGYVDVIVAHQYGFRNVVAPLGTALTGEHVGALKKLTRAIYLALDGDAAGVRATLKALETIRAHSDDHAVPVPTAQGMIRWERDLDVEIRVIALPEGHDPDEVIRENPDRWRALVAIAQPVMDFYISAITSDFDLGSAKGKAEAVAKLAPLVAQVANPVEQAHHIQQIARLVQVEEHIIRAALPTPAQAHKGPPKASRPVIVPAVTLEQEDYLLGWMIRYPAARTAVQQKLTHDLATFPQLADLLSSGALALFERVDNRALWQLWEREPDTSIPETWIETIEQPLRQHAERVLRLDLPQPQSYRYVNDALECATILQLRLARRWKNRLSHQQAESEADQVTILERLVQIKAYIGMISTPRRIAAYDDLHSTLRLI